MKKIIFILIFIFIFSYNPQIPEAIPGINGGIGGAISFINPSCVAPTGILFTLSGKEPGPGSYFFGAGTTLPFLYGTPTNPGKWILGKTDYVPITCMTPCTFGLCPTGIGFHSLYQGGSPI